MKHEIKGKTNVQLLSIGKILQSGQTHIHKGELPDELLKAKQQGLITITKVKEQKEEPAKLEPKPVKEEEPKEETPEDVPEEPPADEGINLDDYDLGDMTRDELDELAEKLELDPKDYSNMTKLKAAIRKAGE